MIWDPDRQEIVIFGGNGTNEYSNDIWSYSSATAGWTEIDSQVNCPGNFGFSKPNGTDDTAFKYDPVNKIYWIFGVTSGYRCLTFAPLRTAGSGSSPMALVDPNLTSVTPDDYVNWKVKVNNITVNVSGYDISSKTLTLGTPISGLTAGSTYQLYATTGTGIWYFNPATKAWVGQNNSASYIGPTPAGGRIAPAVAYSDAAEAFVLFGGKSDGADRSVWRLDVRTKLWTQLPIPATGTPPHMREMLNSMVYDKANDVFILFGGRCSYDPICVDNTQPGQTWAYTLSTNTWVNMNPPVAPSPRDQHVMAYDSDNGVTTLFGGATAAGVVGDTWFYHYPSNTWTKLAPVTSPPPTYLAQVAYDPLNKRTVLFGGVASGGLTPGIWGLKLSTTVGVPAVSLTSPSGLTTLTAPANITLSANASDSDGSIAKVEFFSAATKLGESLSAPYNLAWNSVPAGTYTLTAVATDNTGLTATSSPVTVLIIAANKPPTVSVTSPSNGGAFTAPASISLTANAVDSDGAIAKVEFFAGSTKLGTALSQPYVLTWSSVSTGNYSITAVATDNLGLSTTSSPVSVSVTGNSGYNVPPSVSLSAPANLSAYTAPANITLSANASDSDGSIAKVEFFSGATKLGESLSAPYNLAWNSVPAGNYTLTVKATDNLGLVTTSSPVSISVNAASNQQINVAAQVNGGIATASSTYSSSYPVAAVNDGNRVASNWGNGGGWNDASSSVYPDWAQVTFNGVKSINRIDVVTLPDNYSSGIPPTASDTFNLYGITSYDVQYWTGSAWTTVPGGSVVGNNLVWRTFTFAPVSTDRIRVVVNASLYFGYSRIVEIEAWSDTQSGTQTNVPPSVSLSAPANLSAYTAPANITLSANASDSDGSIAKVEFFSGATKLGESLSAPYNLAWNSVPAGNYTLTVKATDNLGLVTTSSPVSISVNAASNQQINVAAQVNGGIATASSTYSSSYPVAAVNDGNRVASNWGNGGGWNDASSSVYPDWAQVTFNGVKSINRIDVVTLPDNYSSGIPPTASDTFNLYGITSYDVQYWTGSAWTTVPGGSVVGNNLVWRTFTFAPVSTDRIRVVVNASLYFGYSRIVEIEAWSFP